MACSVVVLLAVLSHVGIENITAMTREEVNSVF